MKWNFRVINFSTPKESYKEICEVYYDGDGQPIAHCLAKVGWNPDQGQSGLKLLEMMSSAFNKPELSLSDFKDGGNANHKEEE